MFLCENTPGIIYIFWSVTFCAIFMHHVQFPGMYCFYCGCEGGGIPVCVFESDGAGGPVIEIDFVAKLKA